MRKLRLVIPKKGTTPFRFSAMFAGIGDGRHMYPTLINFGLQMKARKASAPAVQLHLTAIDVNSSPLESTRPGPCGPVCT